MRSKRLTARLAAEAVAGVTTARPAPMRLPMKEAAPVAAHKEVRKKGLSIPWVFAGVLFVAVAVAFVFRQAEVMAVQRTLAEMQAQIDHYRSLNASLAEQVAALQSDEYIEKAAREKLGLVKPGEVQYMVIGYDAKTAISAP